jgi:putative transposase
MDACSRRIVGWSIDSRQDTGRSLLARRIHYPHSDHGTQPTSWAFGKRLGEAGPLGSVGTVSDCYDKAMLESFWGVMQLEPRTGRNGNLAS